MVAVSLKKKKVRLVLDVENNTANEQIEGVKELAKDKNINTEPRKTHGEVNVGGVKFRVLGDTSSEMKNRSFKIKKRS